MCVCVGGRLLPSEEFRCSPLAAATSPRTAELSGLCALLWEATLGGRGWSAWLLLFVEKLLEWVRQKGRLFLLQPWGSAVQSGAFLTCPLVLHLPENTSDQPQGNQEPQRQVPQASMAIAPLLSSLPSLGWFVCLL